VETLQPELAISSSIRPKTGGWKAFLAAAGYPDSPNFDPPPKICRKNAAAETAAEFYKVGQPPKKRS